MACDKQSYLAAVTSTFQRLEQREEVQSNVLIAGSLLLSNEGLPCQTARHMELSGEVLGLHTPKSSIFMISWNSSVIGQVWASGL